MHPQARSVVIGWSAALLFTAGCAGDITGDTPGGEVAQALGQPVPLPLSSGLQARVLRGSNDEPLCVDVAGARNDYGSDLILHPCHGGANQRFSYNRSSGVLHSQLNGDWCLDGGDPTGRMQL